MQFLKTRKSAARLVFVIGFLSMLLGAAFLIGSLMEISQTLVLVSFLLVLLGICCAVFTLRFNRRSSYLFYAGLFFQGGLFLFLDAMHIIPIEYYRAWPLLSIFAGIAFLPAGWRRYGKLKANYIVISAAFIALGSVLLVFSLNLVGFSLAHFVRNWWPLLLLLAGLMLTLVALGTRLPLDNRK
ncbi:MAG: hypothetical protein LBU85_12775 [Treponema sp.]|jgi:hypothetical protein|nr:hypothetical protein [Treponema sp.]